MLQALAIKNFAIIDDLTIDFQDGLTVLSGETGAGKSILINALNLLLGSRASSKMIRTGCSRAEVSAVFSLTAGSAAARVVAESGYDPDGPLIIRRVLSENDRHKVYVNDSPATMQRVSKITENLASIAGQHAHQSLLREDQHLLLLDQFSGLIPLRERVKQAHADLVPRVQALSTLKKRAKRQDEERDLFTFQKQEILSAGVQDGEDAALAAEINRLRHGESLYQAAREASGALYTDAGAIAERLSELHKSIQKQTGVDDALSPAAGRLEALALEAEDLAGFLHQYADTIEIDPERLEQAEARLDQLNRLKRKYGGSLAAVMAKLAALTACLDEVAQMETTVAEAEAAVAQGKKALSDACRALSQARHDAAPAFCTAVETELTALGMAGTVFSVALTPVPDSGADRAFSDDGILMTDTGMDRGEFQIAPNVGEALKPLAAIASGGELSRVVLALKVMLARMDAVETVVFDEVDAGIGGSTADRVGLKIAALAAHHQVICITHLPQIARFGNAHFRIEKSVKHARTRTNIIPLDRTGRIDELARMLGGMHITDATRTHAREMLASAAEGS